ncbi:c-type cytochrome [Salinisphaera orenii]|uniref:c-type cytochrome n=1 Tax=Salinisphaera orenii TaxID=856731 RepID=UPI000DBEA8DE
MRAWKIVGATLVISFLAVGVAFATVVYTGAYNVAATSKHLSVTYWTIKKTYQNSIANHASSIETPKDFGTRKQVLMGAANYKEMCSGCHTPPGGKPSAMAKGMYPLPPNLSESGEKMPANQIFWILQHGIKASGMPAWGVTHGKEELWALTAFVKKFPELDGKQYQQLLKTAEKRGIGHHMGEGGHHHGESGGGHAHGSSEGGHHGESEDAHNDGHNDHGGSGHEHDGNTEGRHEQDAGHDQGHENGGSKTDPSHEDGDHEHADGEQHEQAAV